MIISYVQANSKVLLCGKKERVSWHQERGFGVWYEWSLWMSLGNLLTPLLLGYSTEQTWPTDSWYLHFQCL